MPARLRVGADRLPDIFFGLPFSGVHSENDREMKGNRNQIQKEIWGEKQRPTGWQRQPIDLL
jgi:hypothetical protein